LAYLKSLLIAVLGALTGAFLWIVIAFVLPIVVPMLIGRALSRGAGVGAASAVITPNSILLAALTGFVVAGAWALRRYVLAP
jgi:hypothetical protein